MRNGMAETAAEANAQTFMLPPDIHAEWREFAALLDGYSVAKDLGLELREWPAEQHEKYEQTGTWDLDVLELRLMVFFEYRADYFSGYTYHERDAVVDSLLKALSEKTGQPYRPMSDGGA